MPHAHHTLIERFYAAMQRRDGDDMARCYHSMARFRDPVFELCGQEIGDMWRMLTARGRDLQVRADRIQADDRHGRAHWVARYTFSATGRHVTNAIDAHFRFEQGLITEHIDHFSFWHWSAQALGPVGLFLGWTPLLRRRVRDNAMQRLLEFRSQQAQ